MTNRGEDCYFYYYSSCNKGSKCQFRHCEAARGSEIVCPNWQQRNQCSKVNCEFRHAVIEKSRSAISCFWESQPGGCQKQHCVFKHSKPRPKFSGEAVADSTVQDNVDDTEKVGNDFASKDGATSGQNMESLSTLEKRLKPGLTGKSEDACVSDSEVTSSKKRKRVAVSDIALSSQDRKPSTGGQSEPVHSEITPVPALGQRKICLRKPISKPPEVSSSDTVSAKEQANEQEQPVKKRRMWRRKSASPNFKIGSPESALVSEAQSSIIEEKSEPDQPAAKQVVDGTANKEEHKKPISDGADEEYKAKLVAIFGPDLADMYLREGIKLDLSQYPS